MDGKKGILEGRVSEGEVYITAYLAFGVILLFAPDRFPISPA